MFRLIARTAVASLFIASSAAAQSPTWAVDSAHTLAEFTVRHMMVSNVKGAFGKVAGKARMTGDLTSHGVTKTVTFEVTRPTQEIKDQGGNLRMGASAVTAINRKDFGLMWNRTLDAGGVVVGDEVTIAVEVELVKRAGA